jgi:hypothetical protein
LSDTRDASSKTSSKINLPGLDLQKIDFSMFGQMQVYGFMVCMGLRMSPRILIQKTDLRDFFRRTNPATRKSTYLLLGAYMRRAGAPLGKPTQLN